MKSRNTREGAYAGRWAEDYAPYGRRRNRRTNDFLFLSLREYGRLQRSRLPNQK